MRLMIHALLAGSALVAGSPLHAAEIVVTPAAERGEDGRAIATLIFLNDGTDVFTPPATLEAFVAQDGVDMPVVLTREASGDAIAAGGYAKQRYAFVPPESVSPARPIQLRISGDMAVTASLILARPVALTNKADAEGADETAPAEVQLATTPPDSRAEPEAVAEASADGNLNFSTYRSNYALLGTSPFNAKLQFSFKYALLDPDGTAASDFSFLRGVYFGFTQTMFWDLGVESSPFRSIDFQPELFYRYRSDLDLAAIKGSDINFQMGVKHYSNGKDGDASRSFNTVYVEPSISVPLGDEFRLTASPRAWVYFGDLEDNPDIGSFRGNSGLRLTLAHENGARLESTALGFIGTGRGSLQTDASYPLKFGFLDDINLRLHGQFFTGYGDNLLDYNRQSTRFRLGVSLIP